MNQKEIFEKYLHTLVTHIIRVGEELYPKISRIELEAFYSYLAQEVLAMAISIYIDGIVVKKEDHDYINMIVNRAIEKALKIKQEIEDEF